MAISTGFPYCWRRTGFRFACLRFGWTMETGRPNGLDAIYARQGEAGRGRPQLPASSMQLILAVNVTAVGATGATVDGPTEEHGDGLSKAWLWWIGKGVTGWRRTIADAAFANTRSCRKGLDGRMARRLQRQTDRRMDATVEVGYQIQYCSRRRSRSWCCLFVRSRLASLGRLLWRRRGVPRTRSPHCSLRAGQ